MGESEKLYDLEQRFNSHVYTHRYVLPATSSPSITSTMTTIPGLTASLDANATYQLHAFVGINITTSGGTLSYTFSQSGGMTTASFRQFFWEVAGTNITASGTNQTVGGAMTGSTAGSTTDRFVTFEGAITVGSSGGNLNLQAALSSGAATLYRLGTYLDIMQVF